MDPEQTTNSKRPITHNQTYCVDKSGSICYCETGNKMSLAGLGLSVAEPTGKPIHNRQSAAPLRMEEKANPETDTRSK